MTDASIPDAEFVVDREIWPEELPRTLPFPQGRRPPHEHVGIHAEERPDAPAITFYGRTMTWAELDAAVDAFARAMADRGRDGGVCGIFLQNCPQFVIAYHGANRAGMAATPLNPQFESAAAGRQLDDGGADVLVAHTDLVKIAREACAKAGVSELVLTEYGAFAGDSGPVPVPPTVAEEPTFEAVTSATNRRHGDERRLIDVIDAGRDAGRTGLDAVRTAERDASLPDVELSDAALLQYTGGTTGLPKGCVHTHWNVLFKGATTAAVRAYSSEDVTLGTMPMFHVAGKQRYCDALAIVGNHAVLLARYVPEAVLSAVDAYDVTSTWLAVPAIREILDHPDVEEYDLTSLSTRREFTSCSSFGQSLTRELSDDWEEQTGAYVQESGYGLTETHTTDTHTYGERRIEPGFVGQPCYGVEVEIRDFETNESLEPGEQGEIVLSSPATMERYLDRPEATEAVLEPDGFLHTGDVGRLTEEGYLYFLGRRKDTLKVSGHTVSPREVELVLLDYEAIDDVIVVGAPHERRGSVLEAHVVPTERADADDLSETVIAFAEERLAEYKVPKAVEIQTSFPRTDVGKIDRAAYRERLPDEYE